MANYSQGTDATLIVQWYEFVGGPPADVTAQTITITRIAGSAIVVGPTSVGINHLATGLYEFAWPIPANEVIGQYLVVWNATDAQSDPVQASEIITVVSAATAPLITQSDVEACLGRPLTAAEEARIDALIAAASALIRTYTGQDFTFVTDDEITLRPVGTHLRLPQRPVTAVTSVVAVGCAGMADFTLPSGSWCFDGIDLLDVWPPDSTWIVNLPEWWDDYGGPDTYRVVYSHGDAETPAVVETVACSMVVAVLVSPTLVADLASETIGQYSYRFGGDSGGAPGAMPRLTEADKGALKRYRRTQSSIATRIR